MESVAIVMADPSRCARGRLDDGVVTGIEFGLGVESGREEGGANQDIQKGLLLCIYR